MYTLRKNTYIFEEKRKTTTNIALLFTILSFICLNTINISAKAKQTNKIPTHKYYNKNKEFNGAIFIASNRLKNVSKRMNGQFHETASPRKIKYIPGNNNKPYYKAPPEKKHSFAEIAETVLSNQAQEKI